MPQSISDNSQPIRNSTSAMAVNSTSYTMKSQIHHLIENILSAEPPVTSLSSRELCPVQIVDLSGNSLKSN